LPHPHAPRGSGWFTDVQGAAGNSPTLTLYPKGTDPTLAINGSDFKIDSTGKITFAASQTFPGSGTVSNVSLSVPSSDFTVSGSPVTGSGTLTVNWTVAPTAINLPNAIVKRDALYHSFVESPDMMNIYNGNVTTDANGNALVTMPDWFEALHSDFRYQLTVIGQFAQAIVSRKIANHSFAIKTDKPNVEVSWQVTGIRQDAWAKAHRIPVEQSKTEREQGLYLHPERFGAPPEKSIAAMRHPAPKIDPGIPARLSVTTRK